MRCHWVVLVTLVALTGALHGDQSRGRRIRLGGVIPVTDTSALPSGWSSQDIGTIGTFPGTVSYSSVSQVWTLTSSGNNVFGASDNFRFAYTTCEGNCTVTAQITAVTGYQFAQAGIMMRGSLDADAPLKFCTINPEANNYANQAKYRLQAGQNAVNESNTRDHRFYLRLTRNGSTLTCESSTDGVVWADDGTDSTITNPISTYYAGLAVTNIDTTTEARATFANVAVSQAVPFDSGCYRPHYQGYGCETLGGMGTGATTPTVCAVNSLADTNTRSAVAGGPPNPDYRGTLRGCVTQATVPTYVVFETSGTIALTTEIVITNPYMTIAGQTAPSPGINIRNYAIRNQTTHVVLQHLRIRKGDTATSSEATLYAWQGSSDLVWDHISASWSPGVTLNSNGVTGAVQNLMIVDSIISEALGKAANPWGLGSLIIDANGGRFTFARNVSIHNGGRNPWIGMGNTGAVYNNVTYNWKAFAADTSVTGAYQVVGGYPRAWPVDLVFHSNVAVAGPDTHADGKMFKMCLATGDVTGVDHNVYLQDNTDGARYITSATGDGQWASVTLGTACDSGLQAGTEAVMRSNTIPSWWTSFGFQLITNTGTTVRDTVLPNAGARPTDRTSEDSGANDVDTRVIADVTQGDGFILSQSAGPSQDTVGGHPTVAANTQTFSVPTTPHAAGTCGTLFSGTARSAMVCTLETAAQAVEISQGAP